MALECENNERKNPNRVLESIIAGRPTSLPTTSVDPDTGQVVDSQTGVADTTSSLNSDNLSNVGTSNLSVDQINDQVSNSPENNPILQLDQNDQIIVPGIEDLQDLISDSGVIPTNSIVPNMINRLRTTFPQLNNRVFGIIDMQRQIQSTTVPDSFTVYITHNEDRNINRGDNKRNKYQFEHSILIYSALPLSINDLRSEFAMDQLYSFRDVLISTLWGYQLGANFEGMIYENGEFLFIENNIAYYKYEFTTIENINRSSFNNSKFYNFQLDRLCFCPTEEGFNISTTMNKVEDNNTSNIIVKE